MVLQNGERRATGLVMYRLYTYIRQIITTASRHETTEFCAVISLANVVNWTTHNRERGDLWVRVFVRGDRVGGFSVA
jgi:hypothetical protein